MNTLFFDVALDKLRVCLICNDKIIQYTGGSATGKIAEALLPKIVEILDAAKLDIKDIDNVCVGIGPGSFTGVRIAVSTAKGLLATSSAKLFAVTSFEMLSYSEVELQNLVVITKAFSSLYYASVFGNECCKTIDEIGQMMSDKKSVVLCEKSLADELANFNVKTIDIDLSQLVVHILKTKKSITIRELEPLYLRASQAEIELQKKVGKI